MSEPSLITERDMIRSVAERWRGQYAGDLRGRFGKTARQLDALDVEHASADDVATIIGNRSWTEVACDGCGDKATTAVQVGAEPDYESSTAVLCPTCLRKAVALLPDEDR